MKTDLEENDTIRVFDNGGCVGCEKVFDFRVLSAGMEFSGRFTTWQARHFNTNRTVIYKARKQD